MKNVTAGRGAAAPSVAIPLQFRPHCPHLNSRECMSDSKKRKGASIAVEAAQTFESSQPQPDDESDLRRRLAAMRAQRDESHAELAAAQAEVEP